MQKTTYYKELKEKQKKKVANLLTQLPTYVVPYLDEKQLNSQMNTVISYTYDLIIFFQYLKDTNPLLKNIKIQDIPIEFLENLTFEDINDYQKYLSFHEGKNPHMNEERGIAQRLAALRGFFQFACLHKYINNNPTIGIATRKKIKEHEIVRLTSDEVQDFLKEIALNGSELSKRQQKYCLKTMFRDTAIIILMLNTGIRVSECVGLNINDINFKENSFVVTRKGGSRSTLYFGDEVRNALKEYITFERPNLIAFPDEQALFLSLKKQRLSIRSIQVMVKKFSSIAIPDKKITPHKMRSTYGTALYKETGDIRLVADVLGHKDINTTAKHYAAQSDEHRRQAANISLWQNPKS